MVVQKFLKDLRRVWVRGSASFLPTAQIQKDAQQLQTLQSQAKTTTGQKQALDAANQLAGLEQNSLLQIRALLIQEQQALAAKNTTTANDDAMHQAATQTYYGTILGPQPHTGW